MFQGNDLKLGNIYDILGETKNTTNRYKSDIDSQAAQVKLNFILFSFNLEFQMRINYFT